LEKAPQNQQFVCGFGEFQPQRGRIYCNSLAITNEIVSQSHYLLQLAAQVRLGGNTASLGGALAAGR